MIIQCCICKKVRRQSGWQKVKPEEIRQLLVSHGYCPRCKQALLAELENDFPADQAGIFA